MLALSFHFPSRYVLGFKNKTLTLEIRIKTAELSAQFYSHKGVPIFGLGNANPAHAAIFTTIIMYNAPYPLAY